jgi:hypothetical protein
MLLRRYLAGNLLAAILRETVRRTLTDGFREIMV